MGKCAIITLATPLNTRFGKEPGTDPLSQPIVNQTKYFGFKAIRLITSLLFNGVAASNSNRCSNWADGFLLTKNGTSQERAATQSLALTKANPEVAMADSNIPQDGNLNNSCPFDLSSDSVQPNNLQQQIAATQAEVDAIGEVISAALGLMAAKIDLLERLQEMAKLGPFYELIAGMEGM